MTKSNRRKQMSIDLNLFCDPERCAPGCDFSVPFSRNNYSYATNGHVAVRVPRRPDIPENKQAPSAERLEQLPWGGSRVKFGPLPELEGLADKVMDCRSVRIGKAFFFAPYIEWLQTLPALQIGKPKPSRPLPFRFEGGEGLIMPQSKPAP